MKRFLAGAASIYAIASIYFCAVLAQPGVTTPAGAAPLAALLWPMTMAPAFWLKLDRPKSECGP